MRIVCPACAAAYDVPDGRLLPGRVVRCARCDTDWMPTAEPKAAPSEPIAAEPAPPPEPESPPPRVAEMMALPAPEGPMVVESTNDRSTAPGGTKSVWALRGAWAFSVVVLVAAIWSAYSARETVMHRWPPSIRAYAALGLVATR